MNKKNILKKAAALLLGATLTVAATGCNFILTDNQKDMAQTVAKVDITKNMDETEAALIGDILKDMPSEISKRDLIATFLSYGYSQVQNYGYAEVFKSILDSLVQREIVVQYAIAHYAQKGFVQEDGSVVAVTKEAREAYNAKVLGDLDKKIAATENEEVKKNLQDEKALLEKHPEVLTLAYFLTENGAKVEDYNYTVYSLRKSFNDSIDTLEKEYAKVEEKEHNHATSQTLPTGVSTQKEKYYPTDAAGNLDYNIYTGRNLIGDCHNYEAIEGSSTSTRRKAYNDFLSNLQSYNLLQSKGGEVEDTKEATLLDYYYVELASSLGQALINKYFEDQEDLVLDALLDRKDAENKYNELLKQQELAFKNDSSAFATQIDSESATSITLYGRNNFGFVYNILLPFSSEQNEEYANAKSKGLTQDELYNVRKDILNNVKGKDQRAGWINEHEDESYATQDEAGNWNFFTDIISGESEFEELEHYLGVVPFNGTAVYNEETEKYDYTYKKVSVDDVILQFENLIRANLGDSAISAPSAVQSAYELDKANTKYVGADKKVDYSKFVYKKGKVNVTATADDYFKKDSDVYKMVSIANELMFAYSTDTGCLNSYMGYAVSPYKTNFVKEFEYAAQQAVKDGVGAYYAVPTEYGWHIIITTFVFEDGAVYGGYNADEVDVEGSFSNIFYEYFKQDKVTSHRTDLERNIFDEYDNDTCVTRYEKRYKDLLSM